MSFLAGLQNRLIFEQSTSSKLKAMWLEHLWLTSESAIKPWCVCLPG